ncbi:MAG: LysM peptidoglycan-binding domain-containing protein [Ardenticatenales bacterium]|nr:LysM peptidoglycan-binding domain-containing protein [Ardenticatenales bacterium]
MTLFYRQTSYLFLVLLLLLSITGCTPTSQASALEEEEFTAPALAERATQRPSPTATVTATLTATREPTATRPRPSPTQEPTVTPTPSPDPNAELSYTVKSGDTLGQIAGVYGVTVEELLVYNNLDDARNLQADAILRIPVGEARIASMRATTTAVALAIPPATATALALPPRIALEMAHTYQRINNCAPSATSMGLSALGITRSQFDMAAIQKPNASDVNVTAEEVASSIREVGLEAFVGVNGDIALMQQLLAAGFPVLTEEWMSYDGGMGHFRALRGYDQSREVIIYNDSFYGANLGRSYNEFLRDWKPFNNKYVVPYHAEQATELRQILGDRWNPAAMYEGLRVNSQAQVDANPADGYAWWGLGEALLHQDRPEEAVVAFEQALATKTLPWRYLWYRYGYFEALGKMERYEDLLAATEKTLLQMGKSEDLRYHRAVALRALGRPEEALQELKRSLADNPRFAPASLLLQELGG